jgi:hypothetical protein
MTKLEKWYESQKALAAAKEEEIALRKEVFGLFFPNPIEGTNTVELDDGWVLKGVHKLNRKVNEAALLKVQKRKGMDEAVKNTIAYKPSLKKAEYNKLPDAKKAILDTALIMTPGSPSLEVVLPKKNQGPFLKGK